MNRGIGKEQSKNNGMEHVFTKGRNTRNEPEGWKEGGVNRETGTDQVNPERGNGTRP